MTSLSTATRANLQIFGETIRAERLNRGMSVRAVAERVGASPSTISKIESGDPSVSVGTVFETARIVGIDLYGGERSSAITAIASVLTLLPARGRSTRRADNDF